MNCPKCGSVLPQGAQFCNVCNEPIANMGYVAYGQVPQGQPMQGYVPQQGYPQPYAQQPMQGYQQPENQGYAGQAGYPPNFQQSYAQYTGQNYPQGYQPAYGGYYGTPQTQRREHGAFLTNVAQIPRIFLDSFRDPGAVLQGMMERRDVYTAPVVAGLTLLFTFLCAMMVTRGLVGLVFSGYSAFTSISLASDTTVLNQGISYISGKIGPSIGGVAALCQLFAMAFPAAVTMVYLCAVCKARFSLELLCGCVTITTLPTVAVALLSMVGSLLTPALAIILMVFGMVVSFVFMSSLLGRMTGQTDQQLVMVRILCISISVFFSLLFALVVGGMLMGNVFKGMISLFENINSLL